MKSPLRYPGGKGRLAKYIVETFFKDVTKEVVSPFLGGGSVELELASKGVKVVATDKFIPLISFWTQLRYCKDELIGNIRDVPTPITKEIFSYMQRQIKQSNLSYPLMAAWFFILNRCSFSGTTLAGGMSPGTPRFTEASIEKLNSVDCSNFHIPCASDFHYTLSTYKDTEYKTYLDPPYYVESKLYGNGIEKGVSFDHTELARLLKNRKDWVLSYNDCPQIRELYKGYEIYIPEYKYSMSHDKTSKDIIIVG